MQRVINIIDTTGPELELIGSGKTIDSPLYVLRYSQYNDPGVTILKGTTYNIDLNNLNMNILGIYTIIIQPSMNLIIVRKLLDMLV